MPDKPPLSSILDPTTATPPTASINSAASSASPSSGSFPQSSQEGISLLGPNGLQVQPMTPAQFFAYFDIGSTEQSTYETVVGGEAQLNEAARILMQYVAMPEADRQAVQDDLVAAGLLGETSANGLPNASSLTALRQAFGAATTDHTDVVSWLAQNGVGTTPAIQNQISQGLTKAQEEATAPITATVTPNASLAATITNAFEQTMGISPDQAEVNAWISDMQNQELNTQEAPRAEATAEIAQAKSEESALNQLGANGIDAFVTAYANAIGASGSPGASPALGPVVGSTPNSTNQNTMKPGTKLTPGTNVGFNPSSGAEMFANTLPTTRTTTRQEPNESRFNVTPVSLAGGIGGAGGSGGASAQTPVREPGTHPVTSTTSTPTPGMKTAPNLPVGLAGTSPTYGGTFGLSPALWKQAQAVYPQAAKYSTAGGTAGNPTPYTIQAGAFGALAQHLYEESGSWSDVAITLAGGNPDNPGSGHVLNTSEHLQNFAEGIAGQVNSQIESLQNEVNNSTVTVKEAGATGLSSTDLDAEAMASAKAADPVAYYGANGASWGSFMTKMLYGTPLTVMQNTSDTFTGPVGSDTALNSAPTPVEGAPTTSSVATAPATASAT